ncbi:MAG: cytochrome c-type biogenesis protein [Betaproteobacteria bacterium]
MRVHSMPQNDDARTLIAKTIVMRARSLLAGCAILGALVAATAVAQMSPAPNLDTRLKHLELELRCLVCQNQTLADSNAPLAEDLRREVRELAVAGRSDNEIRAFLTARYGDFVLYDPPVQRNTWLLWFGPFVLLAGGALMWWRIGRTSADELVAPDATPTDERDAAARGQALLK